MIFYRMFAASVSLILGVGVYVFPPLIIVAPVLIIMSWNKFGHSKSVRWPARGMEIIDLLISAVMELAILIIFIHIGGGVGFVVCRIGNSGINVILLYSIRPRFPETHIFFG